MADSWRALSGEKNWEGLLLDPIGDDLRRHIIHYGEMAQASYDAYDPDESSITGGNSKYPMDQLFSQVGLGKGRSMKKYTITKYFYATASFAPFNKDTNWMGYVAVSTDEGAREAGRRDIVVAWRGTNEDSEWTNNLGIVQQPASKIFGNSEGKEDIPWVHGGFYSIYTSSNPDSTFCKKSARDQVLGEVSRLVSMYKDEKISVTITGHSLGGALTTLNAIDIARNVFKNQDPLSNNLVTAFVFATPRVGGPRLRDYARSVKNLRILRIENKPDAVPDFPNIGYRDVGQVLFMDTEESEFLKRKGFIGSKSMAHNMEIYLHGVSGTQGVRTEFRKVVERDISLANKHGDNLVNKYGVPISWWDKVDKAGMDQIEDGSWKLNNKNIVSKL